LISNEAGALAGEEPALDKGMQNDVVKGLNRAILLETLGPQLQDRNTAG